MLDIIKPDWPAPTHIRAFTTTRAGGFSQGNFSSLNLAAHVEDDWVAVNKNRLLLKQTFHLPQEPLWLTQIHGTETVVAELSQIDAMADASYTCKANTVCAVLTADCLPLLITDCAGTCVAAIHAGWKGLAAGIIETAVKKLPVDPDNLLVWLGPAIGPKTFEVSADVLQVFIQYDADAERAFTAINQEKWLANIYELAKQRLIKLGITATYGGEHCTMTEAEKFFSFRRDQKTGRMVSLIWIDQK